MKLDPKKTAMLTLDLQKRMLASATRGAATTRPFIKLRLKENP
jgi:hypothetical protein